MSYSHNNKKFKNPNKIKAFPFIFLFYLNSYFNHFCDLLNLLFIHLFAILTLLPMPIFDLISTITSKYTQAFSSFLQAYSDIKQMKNIPQNLSTISQCMLTEYAQGTSKCLNYYIAHEMDKIFLSLSDYSNLEAFYLSIFPIMSEGYLNSDFFNEAWKYKKFYKLAKVYSEKCLSNKLFNSEFADSLIDTFPNSRDSIIILCEMDAYLNYFKENRLCDTVISLVNDLIKNRKDEVIEIFQFLVFFEDKGSLDILSKIDLTCSLEQDNKDIAKSNELENINNNSEHLDNLESYNSEFRYFFLIFKRIRSIKIRHKILEILPILTEYNLVSLSGCVQFILECIKIDSLAISLSLNHYEKSQWSPYLIYQLITKYFLPTTELSSYSMFDCSVEGESSIKVSKDSLNVILLDLPNEPQNLPILSKIMKDENLVDACLKLNIKNRRLFKESKLFDLFLKKIIDVRIFSFLLFVNESLILNNLETILDGIEEKEDFCNLIWDRLFNN